MARDPEEKEPLSLSAGRDEMLPRFRELLAAYVAKGRWLRAASGGGSSARPDDETLSELEALGYIR